MPWLPRSAAGIILLQVLLRVDRAWAFSVVDALCLAGLPAAALLCAAWAAAVPRPGKGEGPHAPRRPGA